MGTNDGTLTLGRLKHFMGAASHRPQPETSLDTGAVILQLISKVRKATKLEKATTPSRRRVGRPRKRKAGPDELESNGGYAAGMPDAEGEVFSPASSSSSTSPSPSPSLLLLPPASSHSGAGGGAAVEPPGAGGADEGSAGSLLRQQQQQQ